MRIIAKTLMLFVLIYSTIFLFYLSSSEEAYPIPFISWADNIYNYIAQFFNIKNFYPFEYRLIPCISNILLSLLSTGLYTASILRNNNIVNIKKDEIDFRFSSIGIIILIPVFYVLYVLNFSEHFGIFGYFYFINYGYNSFSGVNGVPVLISIYSMIIISFGSVFLLWFLSNSKYKRMKGEIKNEDQRNNISPDRVSDSLLPSHTS